MKARALRLAATIAITLIAACDEPLTVSCPSVAIAAISLIPVDSLTGALYPFTGILAIASDGAFRDTARIPGITDSPVSVRGVDLAHGRPGTYGVEMMAAGYAKWTQTQIVVPSEGLCGIPKTRTIFALLRRS